ncbi:LOW QUALITY PROTEIN: stamen-specific protein FIL1 [Populus alba]|uniref:LOW QUALITY PROTEIN: stamen-specific protein FIL1 n=1 Tax=Populus alba TaxID=43335 RepID=UPI00158AF75E|nr:LOW QUALITY PROTEIN: stamen-specific protein FIL1 [Populus alba]
MAALKSLSSPVAVLLLLTALAVQTQLARSQQCTSQLIMNNLNVCAPFVVPGSANTNPSAECCNALEALQHDCLCSTLQISSRLPSQCNLPPLTCSN